MHLYWRVSSASHSPYVRENEADNGEDDNSEMITTFQLGRDAIGNVPPPQLFCLLETFAIFNRLLSKCVCLRGSAPGALPRTPLRAYNAPRPPAGKCGSQTLILRSADSENEPPPPFQILATGLKRCLLTTF